MLEWTLLSLITITFAILSWRNQKYGIAILLLFLPFYRIRFDISCIPMTLIEIFVLILFTVFIIKKILQKKKISLSNYKWWILSLLFIVTVGLIFTENKIAALGVWKAYFIEPILFFLVFINNIKKKKNLSLILKVLSVSALGISLFAIYQKVTGQFIPNELWSAEETRRVTSIYGYPNAIGLYLAPLVVMFIGWAYLIKNNLKEKFYYFAIAILSLSAIWFAESEGALVSVAVGLLFLGLLIKKLRLPTLIILLLLSVCILFIPTLTDLIITKATFGDFSGNLRLIMWQESIQMLKDNFLWGAGLSGYQSAITSYHHAINVFEVYMYPHNLLLNFWSETGILGLIFFLALIIKYFTNYLKVRVKENKVLYIVLISTFIALLTHGIVDVPYFKNDLSILWWLMFAISWVVLRNKKELV